MLIASQSSAYPKEEQHVLSCFLPASCQDTDRLTSKSRKAKKRCTSTLALAVLHCEWRLCLMFLLILKMVLVSRNCFHKTLLL